MANSANEDDSREGKTPAGCSRPDAFSTTRWDMVLNATGADPAASAAALETLCRQYWPPIYAFIRRRCANRHEAEDLTQAFFAHLLEKESLRKADRSKGRFRTFLLASLTNFLTNEWDKRNTLKRGAQFQLLALHEVAEETYSREPEGVLTPEKRFDRHWALLLVDSVRARLKAEYAEQNKAELFAKLEPGLTGELTEGWYAGVASQLGITEGSARVALHRMRRRFGDLLREEVARTVASSAEVDEEIRHLLAAIAA